ncbi:DsbA family protein [Roseococcus sp.]|uniref:DsbA family protein n=1 Tax=Roseococcus sp. TaxID=2109646 RepID=UPI003BAAA69B
MHITYLFDPLCGWCYGASPVLEKIASTDGVDLELVTVGLFAGEGARPIDANFSAYAWSNDQRISRLTGQTFSEDYRSRVLADHTRLFDSGPATLALAAVAATAPARELEALKEIQLARYVEGRDTTDPGVLAEVLGRLGLSEAAQRLRAPDEALVELYRRRIGEGREKMRRFGVAGVPALLVGDGEDQRLVPASALFSDDDGLLASLRAA